MYVWLRYDRIISLVCNSWSSCQVSSCKLYIYIFSQHHVLRNSVLLTHLDGNCRLIVNLDDSYYISYGQEPCSFRCFCNVLLDTNYLLFGRFHCIWTSFPGYVSQFSMIASLYSCRLYVIMIFMQKCQGGTLQIGNSMIKFFCSCVPVNFMFIYLLFPG